jgi:hypothetical protein
MPGRIVAVVMLPALVAAAALGAASQSAAQGSRVVDRTVLCSTVPSGGINEIEIRARAGSRSGRGAWNEPATVKLTTGGVGAFDQSLDNAVGWVIGGRPTADAQVINPNIVGYPYPVRVWGTFAMNVRCRPSKARVPLSTKGLPNGGRAGPLADTYDCETPRRVLVRMRASFQRATRLSRRQGFLLATSETVTEGQLAVRTQSGRPIAYGSVAASGKARLFVSGQCFRD